MIKTTRKNSKSILKKGAVVGAALLMCASFVPLNVVARSSADTEVPVSGQPIITLQGAPSKTVSKGKPYSVNTAKFAIGSTDAGYIIGRDQENATLKVASSSVTATYKNTSDSEVIQADVKGDVYGTFTPKNIGTYVITYKVVAEDGTEYSYDYEINCNLSSANFEFSAYEEKVIPSFYDLTLIQEKNLSGDILLPLPSVYNQEQELQENVTYLANEKDFDKDCVVISVVGGSNENLEVKADEENNFKILGSDIKASGEGQYTISYTYYQGGQYIVSTEKTFTVESSHYKNKDKKSDYTLTTSWATSYPTSAVVGVKTELPVINGLTSETDSPSKESVAVSYTIDIYFMNNGSENPVTDKCLVKEDNKYYFVPNEKGDYRIVYTVKDYYGHQALVANTQFSINDVKDTQKAVVYVYDANPSLSKDEDGKYVSAATKLKTTTGDSNVVVYAVGATDNYLALNDLELKRVIRSNAGSTLLEIDQYHDKNIIFNYDYASFVASNFAVRRDMEKSTGEDAVDFASQESVEKWLKNHNYLIATSDESKKDVEGYAYFAELKNTKVFNESATYRVRYYAKDKDNSATEEIYDITVEAGKVYTDEINPVVKTISSLQNAYLPTDKIEFTVPSVSDNADRRMETISAYRYLDSDKNVLTHDAQDSDVEYAYLLARQDKLGSQDVDKTNLNGWFKLQGKDAKQTIDLSKHIEGAAYVEVFVYTIDDAGNIGYFNKQISISQASSDKAAPVLAKITSDIVVEGNEVILPTLIYTDDNVGFMTARVYVYHVAKDNNNKVVSRELMESQDVSPFANPIAGTYTVKAGSFVASYEGDYQIVVVARDSANNATVTYFNYTASPNTNSENFGIDNLPEETITLAVGATYNLPSPTISMTASKAYDYIGLSDDGVTSNYYTVKMLKASNSKFDKTDYFFSARSKGRYEIEYNVYLIKYLKDSVKEDDSNLSAGDFYLNGEDLMVYDGTTSYYVITDMVNNVLVANTQKSGLGSAYSADFGEIVELKVLKRKQTIDVTDGTAPSIDKGLLDGIRLTYTKVEGGRSVILPRISAEELSEDGIDTAESNVTVTRTRPNGATVSYTVSMNEWTKDSGILKYSDGELRLHMDLDGTYTIKYHVVDCFGNSDELTRPVSYGDAVPPTLEINDGFVNKTEFKLKDKPQLKLDIDKLSMSDTVTTDRAELLKTISIKVVNTDTNTTYTNKGEVNVENGEYNFWYDLDTAGEYKITVTIKDAAGWSTEKSVTVKVNSNKTNAVNVYKVVGTVLIVVAVVILVGVIAYFIFSKVKLDKEEKKRKGKASK